MSSVELSVGGQGSSLIGKGSGKVKSATNREALLRRFMAAGEAEACRCADDPWYHGMAAPRKMNFSDHILTKYLYQQW